MTLCKIDEHKYVVIAIDYFLKWSEARLLEEKTVVSVARFIYDNIICRQGVQRFR